MDTHTFVDELFAGYDQTPELLDFKQEVLGNLTDRIAELQAEGASAHEASRIATHELGDIGEIAVEVSQARGQDVFAQMYLHHKVRPDTFHLIGYIVCGALLVVGLVLAALLTLAGGGTQPNLAALIAVGIGLVALPIGLLVTLGTTQETTSNLPLPVGRAVAYGAGVFVVIAGLAAGGAIVLADANNWPVMITAVLGGLIAGGGTLVYLGVTQTNRKKPWARQQGREWAEHYGQDSYIGQAVWAPFGLMTVACWIIAAGLFVAIGLWIGFQYSWLVFVFALGLQCALLATAMSRAARGAFAAKTDHGDKS